MPANAQVLLESTGTMSRRPDVEAMLQLLSLRKTTLNAPSKVGRSVPGALATEDPTAWGTESCRSDFLADATCEGGLNAFAIAVALSGSTLIWTPFQPDRAPLQSPRIQIWRRRKPPSGDGLQPDQPDADVVNEHG